MDGFWFWGRKWPCGTVSLIGTEFWVVRTVFRPSPDEPKAGLFSKSLVLEIVVYLVPCLWLIWRSKLGRVSCWVNGTLRGRFLVKNSTNEGKVEPLACYGVQQASCGTARYSVAQHAMAWGHMRHFLFCLLPTLDGYNFFVRTLFWVFLDSLESPLSQESIHMPEKGNRYPKSC